MYVSSIISFSGHLRNAVPSRPCAQKDAGGYSAALAAYENSTASEIVRTSRSPLGPMPRDTAHVPSPELGHRVSRYLPQYFLIKKLRTRAFVIIDST